VTTHCCPVHCIDDLCVSSDQGLCGAFRCVDELEEEFYDEAWDDDEYDEKGETDVSA